jgi:hypothetical protein
MGYRYRRQSNWIGWLTFLAVGGAVFVGLVFAVMYFKDQLEEKNRKAQAALPQTNHPTLGRKPADLIRDNLVQMYKKEGKGLGKFAVGEPKEVFSKKWNRKVVIIQVQHGPAGSEMDPVDQVFVLDRTKITAVKFDDWETQKVNFGIDENP